MIRIDSLSHRIGPATILSDISTTLPAGAITALIGPNGAGKSTLINLVGRLLPLQQGSVQVDSMDIRATPSATLAQHVAILGQSNTVASRLTVRDLVAFGRWPHNQGRETEADRRIVADALATFDLTDLATRFLDQLSGGQQQRAFLAMTLAQDTGWLLLDEPLNNLDMPHARALMQRLDGLRQSGKSIVIVVHDVNYAAQWADHVVALRDGRLFAAGTPREVLTAPLLGDLYGMNLNVIELDGRPFVLHHR